MRVKLKKSYYKFIQHLLTSLFKTNFLGNVNESSQQVQGDYCHNSRTPGSFTKVKLQMTDAILFLTSKEYRQEGKV